MYSAMSNRLSASRLTAASSFHGNTTAGKDSSHSTNRFRGNTKMEAPPSKNLSRAAALCGFIGEQRKGLKKEIRSFDFSGQQTLNT